MFDRYFNRYSPAPSLEEIIFPEFLTTANYFVNKGVLNPSLTFQQKPKDIIKMILRPWDKQWTIVVFDIPEKQRKTRDLIRRRLWEWGFRRLQRSVWLSPLPTNSWVKELDEQLGEFEYLTVIRGGLYRSNPKEIVAQKWQIERWKERAEKLVNKISNKNKLSKNWEKSFWTLLLEHPKVPLDLLPHNWPLKKLGRLWLKRKFKI